MNRAALIAEIFRKKSFLCIGLDTELSKVPAHLQKESDPVYEFNCRIIDATRHLCVAYKPNLAFYEALGPQGWQTFARTVEYIGKEHFIIADAKRGDIGNTSKKYAEAFFRILNCDAVTIAPYMGKDSVAPFLEFREKWAIVLALTSNQGSADFQTDRQESTGEELWEKVLRVVQTWGTTENLMFVTGATHPQAFEKIRSIVPDHFLLVPGVGAQGGDLHAICKHGLNDDCGLLVNASRSILYASDGEDFAERAHEEALRLQVEMKNIMKERYTDM
ncbi:MAG TPA: orotidine-5'-phosphate decarboxylase [Saprospiraceae bacterium]|nr:orotidine-5'-phosphate decarboxylase [Saprospiraceae bacterium]HPI06836.1 orotidine-5'-phosphate decarboxylase [Saprospiraceae bacterium]